jgi:hypothetical protein
MSNKQTTLAASVCFVGLLLAAGVDAQTSTYVWSPLNAGTFAGGNNNTIPFWGKSGTYQQVHEKATMGSLVTIKGMGFRPAGNRTVLGRSWDMRLTMSHTTVTASTATTNFSTNLGKGSTTMVFGTPTTWPTFTWKTFSTSGTKPAFTIPFKAPYIYIAGLGNLCWEWRNKNGTSNTAMAMDASSGLSQKGSSLSSSGTGCTATGKTGPAVATIRAVPIATRAFQHNLVIALSNAANSANSMLALSLSKTTGAIGWCAPVVTPLLLLPVKTNSTGAFQFSERMTKLSGSPPFSFYAQFGFTDRGQPGLIGLSNVAGFRTPNVPGAHGISRIYRYNRNANGSELATLGSGRTLGFGLSTAWLQ